MHSPLRVAVIGAGRLGREFAWRCAAAGHRVTLEDVMPEKLRRAQDSYASSGTVAEQVRYATTVEAAVADADIAVDFVPDELESKLEIFCLMDRMAPPRTIFCTPTEALSISDLASCTYRADRCCALSSSPDGQQRLVCAQQTSADTLATMQSFLYSVSGTSIAVSHDASHESRG